MTVLRSRKIVPTKPTPKAPKATLKIGPSTPSRTYEPSTPSRTYEPFTPSRTYEPSILHSPTPPMSSSPNPDQTPTPVSSGLGSDSVSVSGVIRRRSLRLSAKWDSGEGSGSNPVHDCKRKSVSCEKGACLSGNRVEGESAEEIGGGVLGLVGNGEMRSDLIEKRVRVLDQVCGLSGNGSGSEEEKDSRGFGEVGLGSKSAKGKKRKLGIDVNLGLEYAGEDREGKGYLNLRSGKRLAKRGIGGVGISVVDDKLVDEREGQEEKEEEEHNGELGRELIGIGIKREGKGKGKGKGKLVHDDLVSTGFKVVDLSLDPKADNVSRNVVENEGSKSVNERRASVGIEKGKRKLGGTNDGGVVIEKGVVKGRRRFSREEKGKGVALDGSLLLNGNVKVELVLDSKVKNSVEDVFSGTVHLGDNVASQVEAEVGQANATENESTRRDYMERFREVARENASRFAFFSPVEDGEDLVCSEAEAELEFEDWPGPFSTAMKIIKDRATKNQRVETSYLDKRKAAPIIWIPRYSQNHPKRPVPSLKELSLTILAKNADEIESLENIPDALKHKLSHLLCDSRRMNNHSFELLVHGSPREVRLRDCSWLTEEQFTKSFQECDTSNIMVLQLDQCGRCMSDYMLLSTLAQSSNSLPALTTLSLSGACRLTDVGLGKLVSSAPALRSLNISQCSLLTSSSIDILADSLGSILRELYLTDCQSIDAMLILPALKKLEQLQVLSLAGIQNVCDGFLREFLTARGHNMKELVLTDCVKLTDSSLKSIAENCSGLCAIDLGNLCKLTDSAIGYLANGCRAIQTLKLCRNAFSDEAIAAFLETSGEWLKELSLNNVKKVGCNTALSLAKRSRRLHTLDLSWCRSLSDEAVGLIVDNCLSLRVLKLFGCTQITNVFVDGHSNPDVQIVGLKMSSVLEHVKVPHYEVEGPLRYSLVSSPI